MTRAEMVSRGLSSRAASPFSISKYTEWFNNAPAPFAWRWCCCLIEGRRRKRGKGASRRRGRAKEERKQLEKVFQPISRAGRI